MLSSAVGSLARGATAEAGFDNPELLAKVASKAIQIFAVVITVNQTGVAETLVSSLMAGAVGAWCYRMGWPLDWAAGKRRKNCGKMCRQTQDAAPKIAAASGNLGNTADAHAQNRMQNAIRLLSGWQFGKCSSCRIFSAGVFSSPCHIKPLI